jgi:hypothetical protein
MAASSRAISGPIAGKKIPAKEMKIGPAFILAND